jgi:hypothetical protein
MLDIYKVVPILKKLPFDIESLHAYGMDKLFSCAIRSTPGPEHADCDRDLTLR